MQEDMEFKDGNFYLPKGDGFGPTVDPTKLSEFVKGRRKFEAASA